MIVVKLYSQSNIATHYAGGLASSYIFVRRELKWKQQQQIIWQQELNNKNENIFQIVK